MRFESGAIRWLPASYASRPALARDSRRRIHFRFVLQQPNLTPHHSTIMYKYISSCVLDYIVSIN